MKLDDEMLSDEELDRKEKRLGELQKAVNEIAAKKNPTKEDVQKMENILYEISLIEDILSKELS